MTRLTITVSPEIEQALRLEVERRQTSVSEVARTALNEYLSQRVSGEPKRHLGFANLGHSNEPGFANRVDEILAEEWGDPNFSRSSEA